MKVVDQAPALPFPQGTGLHYPDGLRHPLVRHEVHRPAPNSHLGRPLTILAAQYPRPNDRLHAEHGRLAQRPLMVARLLLPRLPPHLTDATQVLIPSQPGTGAEELPCRRIFASRRGGITARAPRRSNSAYTTCRSYIPSPVMTSTGFSTCSSRAGVAS